MDNIIVVYAIGIIGAAIILLSWQLYFSKRKPLLQAKVAGAGERPEKVIKCRVYDCDHKTIYSQDISGDTVKEIKKAHGSLGRQYNRMGELLFALKLKDGEYSPAPIGNPDLSVSPRQIGRALSIGYSISLFYRTQLPQDAGSNLKQILWWTGIIAVIVLLVVVD